MTWWPFDVMTWSHLALLQWLHAWHENMMPWCTWCHENTMTSSRFPRPKLIHSYSHTDWLTHSHTRSHTHSLTHSLSHTEWRGYSLRFDDDNLRAWHDDMMTCWYGDMMRWWDDEMMSCWPAYMLKWGHGDMETWGQGDMGIWDGAMRRWHDEMMLLTMPYLFSFSNRRYLHHEVHWKEIGAQLFLMLKGDGTVNGTKTKWNFHLHGEESLTQRGICK